MGKIYVSPIKIQGIKTKIVPFIKENIWLEDYVWIEPFMGSGTVGFNLAKEKAIFSDTNPYIINFFNDIKNGIITAEKIRLFLEVEGKKFEELDDKYYYEVRERFNTYHNSYDFLLLNRSCFNGLIRFNKKGNFNTPYGHKPKRFSKAYITKIVNQISYVEEKVKNNDWIFVCQSFEETIKMAKEIKNAIIYVDPPYLGRNTDYYDGWEENKEIQLCNLLKDSHINFILSTWHSNQYRKNEYIEKIWNWCEIKTFEHFYHIGAKENNRNSILEALLIQKANE